MIFPGRRGGRRHPRRQRRHLPPVVVIAILCELFALALSVAANLAAVTGLGAMIAAGAIPFLMIGGVYLLLSDRIPVAWAVPIPASRWWAGRAGAPGWALWWANLAAALMLIGPPAVASYWHQREFLTSVGTPDPLAAILPLAVDGLALRAALTLFRLAHQPATTTASGATTGASGGDDDLDDDLEDTDEGDGAGDESEPAPLPTLDGIAPDLVARAAALVAADPTIGRPAIRAALDVGDSPARRLLAALRPMRPIDGGEAA